MVRFEKLNGYDTIQDNEELVYTLCDYEPKQYSSNNMDELATLLNSLNNEVVELKNEIAYLQSKIEEDE